MCPCLHKHLLRRSSVRVISFPYYLLRFLVYRKHQVSRSRLSMCVKLCGITNSAGSSAQAMPMRCPELLCLFSDFHSYGVGCHKSPHDTGKFYTYIYTPFLLLISATNHLRVTTHSVITFFHRHRFYCTVDLETYAQTRYF